MVTEVVEKIAINSLITRQLAVEAIINMMEPPSDSPNGDCTGLVLTVLSDTEIQLDLGRDLNLL